MTILFVHSKINYKMLVKFTSANDDVFDLMSKASELDNNSPLQWEKMKNFKTLDSEGKIFDFIIRKV